MRFQSLIPVLIPTATLDSGILPLILLEWVQIFIPVAEIINFLFTGNYFLYFTVTLKQNKHFKLLWMVVLLMLKNTYALIFCCFHSADMSRGSYFSYIKIFYIRCHLWGQEDFHGHLQYSQQQCDFYDNAITLLLVSENSKLLRSNVRSQEGYFADPKLVSSHLKKKWML